ncbi:MAG: hypothetical protein CL891_03670 [Dehalococcoidia bacterium]|nr:hypothetical protein [Dehalococcoidia bacterium]
MNLNALKSKITRRRNEIIRSIGLFIVLRSLYGIAILGLAYVLGIEVNELREFRLFGFQIYILVLGVAAIIIIRRFCKIYKWWNNDDDTETLKA